MAPVPARPSCSKCCTRPGRMEEEGVADARRLLIERGGLQGGGDVVAVDTRTFERALDAGETALAMAQYGGPLLDGFHLGGEGEFDRWVEQERARLAGRYAQALRTIASAADQRGDPVAAAEYL